MFTTFVAAPVPPSGHNDNQSRQNEQTGQDRNNGTTSPPPTATRLKRSQVARACDWCRLNRVRCDRSQPCHNCQSRGGTCNKNGVSEVRSLPDAVREIEGLKARIKELEEKRRDETNGLSLPSPPSSSSVSLSSNLDPMEEHTRKKRRWKGAYTTNPDAHQRQLYGSSSSFYFISRLSSYVGTALQLPHLDHHVQPKAASMFFSSPTSPRMNGSEESPLAKEDHMAGEYLSRAQENYFLGLFWQSYHCTIPIVDEPTFREHYESLWATGSPDQLSRKPSPLVDIVLALCMQYGIAFVPRNDTDQASNARAYINDSSIAGRRFYRRCQMLLSCESESPSLQTLQCHIFSAIYLRNASFLNMAHSTLAVAIRTAFLLGLDQEPADTLSWAQKELCRRLWWMVFSLESKACMALGRPWQVQISQVTCSLPVDDTGLALLSGLNFASPSEGITWLSYHVQCVKLILAARAVHVAFYNKCADVLTANDGKSFYSDAQSLETIARYLSQNLQCIRSWLKNVPEALKTRRKGDGESFSTDRSPLEIDAFAPLWLQRQRLLLELLYHNLVMCLYRPFICFSPAPSSCTPLADGNAISCLNHAMATTHIVHQVLVGTDILNGWNEVYQFQWDATLSMIGFSFAYPVCPPTPSARKTINSAIAVFDILGNNFAVAASAANVTRDLAAKADTFIDRFRTRLSSSPLPPVHSSSRPSSLQSYNSPNRNISSYNNSNQKISDPLVSNHSSPDHNLPNPTKQDSSNFNGLKDSNSNHNKSTQSNSNPNSLIHDYSNENNFSQYPRDHINSTNYDENPYLPSIPNTENPGLVLQPDLEERSAVTPDGLSGAIGSRFPLDSFRAFESFWSGGHVNGIGTDTWEDFVHG